MYERLQVNNTRLMLHPVCTHISTRTTLWAGFWYICGFKNCRCSRTGAGTSSNSARCACASIFSSKQDDCQNFIARERVNVRLQKQRVHHQPLLEPILYLFQLYQSRTTKFLSRSKLTSFNSLVLSYLLFTAITVYDKPKRYNLM